MVDVTAENNFVISVIHKYLIVLDTYDFVLAFQNEI